MKDWDLQSACRLYEVLNLKPPTEAKQYSDKDIRKAFLDAAKLYHPDKGNHYNNVDRFLEAQDAYQILLCSEKRNKIDNIIIQCQSSTLLRVNNNAQETLNRFRTLLAAKVAASDKKNDSKKSNHFFQEQYELIMKEYECDSSPRDQLDYEWAYTLLNKAASLSKSNNGGSDLEQTDDQRSYENNNNNNVSLHSSSFDIARYTRQLLELNFSLLKNTTKSVFYPQANNFSNLSFVEYNEILNDPHTSSIKFNRHKHSKKIIHKERLTDPLTTNNTKTSLLRMNNTHNQVRLSVHSDYTEADIHSAQDSKRKLVTSQEKYSSSNSTNNNQCNSVNNTKCVNNDLTYDFTFSDSE